MEFILCAMWATWKQARRLVILVVGLSVVAFGVALIVLPGPAFVVIPMGLGILSLEFVWARVWLQRIRQSAEKAASRVRDMARSSSPRSKSSMTTSSTSPSR